ncbi:MAG: universal stress protein [Gemmatimonadales bacterium]|nr:MAG: universal stress protein [Gemmatimonadales bacterium]
MNMFRRILVPLDGSQTAEAVLRLAVPIARAVGSSVELLHVIPDRKSLARMGPEDPLDWRMSSRRAHEYLAGPARMLAEAGVASESRIEEGGPAEIIVRILQSGEHGLVAMTPHGRGGTGELSLGCTAGAVLLHAPSSLLLVPPLPDDARVRRIVVPVDGSPRAEWAMDLAFHLADSLRAELQLVHALVRPNRFGILPGDQEQDEVSRHFCQANRTAAVRFMAQLQDRHSPRDIRIEGRILEANGDVSGRLLEDAEASGADLVVLSAHGHDESVGWRLGAVPLRFLLAATVPTLLMQDFTKPKGSARPDAPHLNR